MMPRIAYMTGEYLRVSPFVFMYREIAALRKLGFHIETFTVRGPDLSELLEAEQAGELEQTYVLLPCSPFRLIHAHLGVLTRSPRRYLSALTLAVATRPPGVGAALKQIAYFLEAGLVAARMRARGLGHLHNHFASSSCTVAMLAAELGGFTFSFTIHGTSIRSDPGRWRVDEKAKRAAFVVCISAFCRSQAMAIVPVEEHNRLHVVRCGIDFAPYEAIERAAAPGARLLFVGRLVQSKGLHVLFQALAQLREAFPGLAVRLVGEGPERAALEAQAHELGVDDRVEFVGYRPQDEIRRYLRETDVFVLPSFAEGVPVVLMEAMAAAVPVVATDIAGVPELVEHGASGLLVAPGDADALAAAIAQLLSDPDRARDMGRHGAKYVRREFDIETSARQLATLFENLPTT